MRVKVGETLREFLSSLGPTLERFWASVACSVFLTWTLIRAIPDEVPGAGETLARLSLGLAAGLLASWCTVLLWESLRPKGDPLEGNLLAAAVAAGVTWGTFTLLDGMAFVAVSRHTGILTFLFLSFFTVPHIKRDYGLDMYVVRLFLTAAVAVLFSAVLFAGLSIIIFTITSLFSVRISGYAYLKLWLTMAGTVAPFLFMAGIPSQGEKIDPKTYPPVLSSLMLYVITPLVTAYTGILYVYFAKILFTRQWPVGVVAHLVLWYTAATTAALFFIWPLSKKNEWAREFPSRFAKAVIPLLAMMFVSVGIRMRHYGITENRYYVVVLGLWILAVMVYLALTKKKGAPSKSWVIPATLGIVTLLSVFGPASSFSVAIESQNKRLEKLCTPYGITKESPLPAVSIPKEDQREIVAILDYFDEYHSLEDVRLLPEGFTWASFESMFGFSRGEVSHPEPFHSFHYQAKSRGFDIAAYDYLFDLTEPQPKEGTTVDLTEGRIRVLYNVDTKALAITADGQTEWETTVGKLVSNMPFELNDEYGRTVLKAKQLVIKEGTPRINITLVFTSLWGVAETLEDSGDSIIRPGNPTVHNAGFYLLVGDK